MTVSSKDLNKIAHLAYLDTSSSTDALQLEKDVNAIMDFVEQLSSVDTNEITPLFHPLAQHQRLRIDKVTEENCITELETIAPMFEDQLYLVPKVLEAEK